MTAPPIPPAFSGLSGRVLGGGESGILPSWRANMADLRGAGRPPQNPSRRISSGLSWLTKYLAKAKTQVG
jgi:hypothetical protein